MNLVSILGELQLENGPVLVLDKAIVDFDTYYILAQQGDKPIYATGTEEVGLQYYRLDTVPEEFRSWFEQALADLNLVAAYDEDKKHDILYKGKA